MKKNHKAKKPTRKPLKLLADIKEERILQLSNDLSEGIKSGTVKEWRTVAMYYRKVLDHAYTIRPSVSALLLGTDLITTARTELREWLKDVKS